MEKTINFNDLMYNDRIKLYDETSNMVNEANERGTVSGNPDVGYQKSAIDLNWFSKILKKYDFEKNSFVNKSPVEVISSLASEIFRIAKSIGRLLLKPIEWIVDKLKTTAEKGSGISQMISKTLLGAGTLVSKAAGAIAAASMAAWNITWLKYTIIGAVIFTTLMVVLNWWEKREKRLEARAKEEAEKIGKKVEEVNLPYNEIEAIFAEGIEEANCELAETFSEAAVITNAWGTLKSWVDKAWKRMKDFYEMKIKPNAGKILKALFGTAMLMGGWVLGGWLMKNYTTLSGGAFKAIQESKIGSYILKQGQDFKTWFSKLWSKEEVVNIVTQDGGEGKGSSDLNHRPVKKLSRFSGAGKRGEDEGDNAGGGMEKTSINPEAIKKRYHRTLGIMDKQIKLFTTTGKTETEIQFANLEELVSKSGIQAVVSEKLPPI